MQAEQGILSALVEIKRRCTERVEWPSRYSIGIFRQPGFPLYHILGGLPRRPLRLAADGGLTLETQSFLSDGNAVASGLSTRLYEVEVTARRIDDDSSRRFPAAIRNLPSSIAGMDVRIHRKCVPGFHSQAFR
ncbi:hypothetical protein QO002_005823 [Pararhizobium capsulatum DSM 1112]|uniref:Uncharacterized protein n=1 Tax=Pararhizobium capsulatum DSM 1112 TaxID=1121113 RepID=A0ABU0C3F9_9HYPH|nr:hypothetical protein [Pararhizobium capsulatum DSM 1112]